MDGMRPHRVQDEGASTQLIVFLRLIAEPRREKKIKSWRRLAQPASEQNERPTPSVKATQPLPVETIP